MWSAINNELSLKVVLQKPRPIPSLWSYCPFNKTREREQPEQVWRWRWGSTLSLRSQEHSYYNSQRLRGEERREEERREEERCREVR